MTNAIDSFHRFNTLDELNQWCTPSPTPDWMFRPFHTIVLMILKVFGLKNTILLYQYTTFTDGLNCCQDLFYSRFVIKARSCRYLVSHLRVFKKSTKHKFVNNNPFPNVFDWACEQEDSASFGIFWRQKDDFLVLFIFCRLTILLMLVPPGIVIAPKPAHSQQIHVPPGIVNAPNPHIQIKFTYLRVLVIPPNPNIQIKFTYLRVL
jgi:hypothetical protein